MCRGWCQARFTATASTARTKPSRGHRFNANKLLIDPYTRELRGAFSDHDATYGYDAAGGGDDLSFSASDSAPHVPKSVVSDPALFPARRKDADLRP